MLPPHLLHEQLEREVIFSQLAVCHVLKELVELRSLFIAVGVLNNVEKFLKLNHARAVLIHVLDHVKHVLARVCKAQTYERVLQLIYADGARAVIVEGAEAFLQLLDLVVLEI